jgi:hypothetical protein
MSRVIITRSARSSLENDLVQALASINGKIKVKLRKLIIVEFNHRCPDVAYTFVEIIPFKLMSNGSVKVIYSDMRAYNKSVYFKNRYGDNKELLDKIKKFLQVM